MRVVFMGTPDFAVPVLKSAVEAGCEVVGVYTQPDKPVGRKQVLTAPPVKAYALSQGIPVFQPRRVKRPAEVEALAALQPDLILVAAYGQILSQEILDLPKFGCINMHASLLPKYRGASPIQHCILAGDTVTGITAMQMDAGMDTGAIIDTIEVPIEDTDTADSLHDRLAEAAGVLTDSILHRLMDGEVLKSVPQDNTKATSAPLLHKEDGLIAWDRPAKTVYNQIRGLYSWPGTYTFWEGRKLSIWEAKCLEESAEGVPCGTVRCTKKTLDVACQDQWLRIVSLQLEGRKRMDSQAFLLGQHPEGAVFGA